MIFKAGTVQEYLQGEFRRRAEVNPRYSLRAFARQLHMSPGELSEVLKNKRRLSLKSAGKVAKAMALNAGEAKQLFHLALADKSKGYDFVETQPQAEALSDEIFRLVSDWYHFAILNLIDCQGFRWSNRWISRRLGISQAQSGIAMSRLLQLGLVEVKAGKVKARSEHLSALGDIPSAARRGFHRQILEKSKDALEIQGADERDISGVGMALDPQHLPAIKKEISDFQDRILAQYGNGKKTEVYFLQIAMFRLTQEGEK